MNRIKKESIAYDQPTVKNLIRVLVWLLRLGTYQSRSTAEAETLEHVGENIDEELES